MPSIPHLTTAVEALLATMPDLSRAARQRLVFFVLGVLLTGSIVLRRVQPRSPTSVWAPSRRPVTNDDCAAP